MRGGHPAFEGSGRRDTGTSITDGLPLLTRAQAVLDATSVASQRSEPCRIEGGLHCVVVSRIKQHEEIALAHAGGRGQVLGQTGEMVHESVHVSTTIDCPAGDVYAYASNPLNLSSWAAGLADQDAQLVDRQWVVDSPMGRVVVAFAPSNDFGILDHDVTLPVGETVRNPMRVIPNGDGCDVVFTVRRRPGMSEQDFAADVEAVTSDLATLRTLMER